MHLAVGHSVRDDHGSFVPRARAPVRPRRLLAEGVSHSSGRGRVESWRGMLRLRRPRVTRDRRGAVARSDRGSRATPACVASARWAGAPAPAGRLRRPPVRGTPQGVLRDRGPARRAHCASAVVMGFRGGVADHDQRGSSLARVDDRSCVPSVGPRGGAGDRSLGGHLRGCRGGPAGHRGTGDAGGQRHCPRGPGPGGARALTARTRPSAYRGAPTVAAWPTRRGGPGWALAPMRARLWASRISGTWRPASPRT